MGVSLGVCIACGALDLRSFTPSIIIPQVRVCISFQCSSVLKVVRRSSPNLLDTSRSSLMSSLSSLAGIVRSSLHRSISLRVSASSFSIFTASIWIRRWSFKSKIASTCGWLKLKAEISCAEACSLFSALRIIDTTLSILAVAISSPLKMFSRACAVLRSNFTSRRLQSRMWVIYASHASFQLKTLG